MGTINSGLDDGITIGCGCAACESGTVQNNTGNSGTDTQGAPGAAASAQTIANYLIYGDDAVWRQWDKTNLTFKISNNYSGPDQDKIRMAFDLWQDVTGLTFTETGGAADITLHVGGGNRAYANTSYIQNGNKQSIVESNIYIDTSNSSWNHIHELGGYSFLTVIHEIGHALGLGHSGNYDAGSGQPISYNNNAIWENDTHQMTVMSYFNASNIGSDHSYPGEGWQYPVTPMLADIVAIQQLYGANTQTRSGDTVYGVGNNTGLGIYTQDGNQYAPLAIWDGGGIDTLNFSDHNQDQVIYLTEGDFSSTGYMTNNLVIAYGTVIENATGGSGDDTIYGNDADNVILGGGGNDTLFGTIGNDTLNGNGGTDTVSYTFAANEFAFNFIDNATLALQHVAQSFTDTLYNIENFIFAGVNYTRAELEAAFGDLEVVAFRAYWGGGNFGFNSEEDGAEIFNATTMGYAASTGNQFTLTRDFYDTTLTVNNVNAAPVVRLYGSDNSDTILVNGTHNSLATQIFAGDGNDTVTILVTGNDRIDGEGGDDVIDTGAGNDRLFGRTGNDTLIGGAGADRLYGMADDDTLHGGDDNDRLDGGDGVDELNGGNGNDLLEGGNGDDILNGDAGDDRIYGNADNDTLNGGAGFDKLYGGAGIDELNGGDDNDRLYGMDGNDTLNGDAGNDILEGGNDDDILNGGLGNDRLVGDAGNDTLNGGDGKDRLYGNAGQDILNGGAGQDTLIGGADNDELNGDAGNDFLYGQDGDDVLNGGANHDTLYGENDNDILNGEDGIDTLNGGSGNDILNGGNDNDTLYGGTGTDTLIGGAGTDLIFGQQGSDVFGFVQVDGAVDQIRDFTLNGGEADALNITDILVGFNGGSDINDFVLLNFKNADRTDLFVDLDGVGGDWQQIAVIRGSDFTGIDAQDLVDSNQLITNTTLL